MKTLVAIVVLWFVATSSAVAAPADGPQKYIVLSRIGDALSIVGYRPTVGSRLDTNAHDTILTPEHTFDRVALGAAERALHRAMPAASVTMLGSTSSEPYPDREAFIDDHRLTSPAWLDQAIAGCACDRLVLITKYSSDARVHGRDSSYGSGKLSGLGFYIDRDLRTRRGDTGERGRGFISPFVYIAVTLVDTRDRQVLAQRVVTASRMVSAARSTESADPWEALSADEKSRAITGIIEREVPKSIAEMLAS